MVKRKRSRRSQVGTIPRGGFSTGMGGKRAGSGKKGNLGRTADAIKKGAAFIRVFKDYDDIADHMDTAAGILDTADQLHNDYVKPMRVGFTTKSKTKIGLTYNPSAHTNGDEKIIPAFVENSQSKHVLANADDDRAIHKTVYHTGKKPSSAVLTAKKANGSGYRLLTDSIVDVIAADERNILTQRVGFNQKQYHAPPIRAQVPVYLIKDLIGWDQLDTAEMYSPRSVMSDVINIKQQFMIKNTAAHFPMKFTIHLVKLTNLDYSGQSLNSLLFKTFYNASAGADLDDYSEQNVGMIPKYLQHDLMQLEGSGDMQSSRVLVSNKLRSLNKSSNFRSGAEIVESFSKVIPPGDFWNFSHIHHCGSGIDLTSLYRSSSREEGEEPDLAYGIREDQSRYPFHLGIIFECQGKTAEAYSVPAEGIVNTYIGSSPCSYAYEYKTAAYFAAKANDGNNITTPNTRTYEQDYALEYFGGKSDAREKYFLPTELSSSVLLPTLANVGKAYVPMMTSTATSTSLFESTQDPG